MSSFLIALGICVVLLFIISRVIERAVANGICIGMSSITPPKKSNSEIEEIERLLGDIRDEIQSGFFALKDVGNDGKELKQLSEIDKSLTTINRQLEKLIRVAESIETGLSLRQPTPLMRDY